MTGNAVFSPLFEMDNVQVAAVFFSAGLTNNATGPISSAFTLRKRMDTRYWWFLVVTNGLFYLFSALTSLLNLSPKCGIFRSIEACARQLEVPLIHASNFNDLETKNKIRSLNPDLLLIRISTVLDEEVLSIPSLGTWCVHSSLLPAYGGIAGEFQALREGQAIIGSTVFEVTPKLDEGPPLGQVSLATEPSGSLLNHIAANNIAAAELLAGMVYDLSEQRDHRRPLLNRGLGRSYYSWPKQLQVDEFLRSGRKLVKLAEVLKLAACALRINVFRIQSPSSGRRIS